MFAGCGGMDLGFKGGFSYREQKYRKLGFKIVQAYENDERAIATYSRNVGPEIEYADLSSKPAAEMPNAHLLIGGFPCQDFSSCGPQAGLKSERGRLYLSLVEYMDHHQPLVVVAENVINLQRMKDGAVLKQILDDMRNAGLGYRFEVWNLLAPDYGVPQYRRRLFLVGVRSDLDGFPVMPRAKFADSHRPIEWAIQDLESVTDDSVLNQDQYFLASRAKKGNGQGDETNRRGEPSYCIRANPKSRVQFHYSLPRRLTVRECARLQTFPDDFEFFHSTTANMIQIGNAVPPILAHEVARSISKFLHRSDIVGQLENQHQLLFDTI